MKYRLYVLSDHKKAKGISKRNLLQESHKKEQTKDYLGIYPTVIRCNGSHTSYNGDDPVSLTKDGPKMKAWEEMRAPDNEHDIIIRSKFQNGGEFYI